jgi:hypothetical protein
MEALFAHPEKEIKLPPSAADLATRRQMPAPPEIVQNVQGSSAGAGSGEFHVYKASRRRENERVRLMEEEVEKEARDREWEERKVGLARRDEEKRSKNKARREKAKARKEKASTGGGKMELETKGTGKAGPVVLPKMGPVAGDAEGMEGGEVRAIEEVGIVIHDDD